MSRPPNPYSESFGPVAARIDNKWRVLPLDLTQPAKRCRWGGNKPCRLVAVAELDRGRWPWSRRKPNWWAYCGEHLYGRWVEDGHVMKWWSA